MNSLFYLLSNLLSLRRSTQERSPLVTIGTIAVVLLAGVFPAVPAVASDYLLSPGDQLELGVLGVLSEPQKAEVGVDGMVSFPLVGEVKAAGRTLKDVRTDVRDILTRQPFRRHGSDLGVSTYSIVPNEVFLQISEYRPIYVSGDVLHPGQVIYRPGLRVRQAVAMTGGFGGKERSETELVQLRNKYETAALDFARSTLQADALGVELGLANDSAKPTTFPSVNPATTTAIVNEEKERSAAREQAFDSKRSFLKRALDQSEVRIGVLETQVSNEQKGADLDAAEVTTVDDLLRKGLVQAPRLLEARRSSFLSASRALQTKIALEDAKRDRTDLQSKLDGLDRDRKVELLTDLEKANSVMRSAAVEMQGLQRQLALQGDVSDGVQIMIFRNGSDAAHGAISNEDAELLPGDTLDIKILRQESATSPQITADK
jgi:polysaccharide export outer membrane protein